MSDNKQSVTMPVRSFMEPENTQCPFKWRYGHKPDYSEEDRAWAEGKLSNHLQNSIEMVVENLVKTWEFEATHKIDSSQWGSIDREAFRVGANDNPQADCEENIKVGTYNILLKNESPYYEQNKLSFEDSHSLFHTAMKTFPWEVLKVHRGPPTVIFDWRHWGYVDGVYTTARGQKIPPSGKLVELFGYAIVEVDSSLKIRNIRVYFDPKPFFEALEKGISTDDIKEKNCFRFETSKHFSMYT